MSDLGVFRFDDANDACGGGWDQENGWPTNAMKAKRTAAVVDVVTASRRFTRPERPGFFCWFFFVVCMCLCSLVSAVTMPEMKNREEQEVFVGDASWNGRRKSACACLVLVARRGDYLFAKEHVSLRMCA